MALRRLPAGLGPGAHALVTVHRVLFPETDFQPEGLAAALLLWVEREFGLPPFPVGAVFDRAAYRYRFTWPGDGAAVADAASRGWARPPRAPG